MSLAVNFYSTEFFRRQRKLVPGGQWTLYDFPEGVFNANSIIQPHWEVHFLQSDTSTPLPVYADSTATIKHAYPVKVDRYGNVPTIYTNSLYDYYVSIRNEFGVERYVISN